MSSRITNSESQRGMKGETLPEADIRERHSRPRKESHSSFRGANPSRWSDVEANDASKSDDCSTWPSWESSPGDNNVKRDDDIGDMRHKIPADPAFDGRRQQHQNSRPLDDSWSQPQRVRDSVRSRDKDGSRSRSRSRSRDRGNGGRQGRSRSPFHDDRHESNANIDRVSGPRLSSRVCRDFATGKCRRGSNCRFPHQENLSSQGGRHSETEVTQRSSSRPEYEGASRYGNNRDSHDKVSDGSRRNSGKDEPDNRERSSSRPEYGGASRYDDNRTSVDRPRNNVSDGARRYNVASGDNHNRENRNASYNHDGKGPPNRSGKVPCKFFPIGKCHREDCRFSHDAPMSESVDGRSRDDRLGHIADEKKKSWNGPTWDEVNASDSSDIAKSSRQHGTSGRNLNSYDSTAYDKHMDDKNMSWSGPAWDEVGAPNSSDMPNSSDRGNSSARNLSSYDTVATGKGTDENKAWNDMAWDETSAPSLTVTTKSVEGGERSFGRNEYISRGASTDAYMDVNEYMGKKKYGNEKAPLVSDSSYRYGRDNPATFDDSNVLDVDMVSEDSTHPVLTPNKVFDQSEAQELPELGVRQVMPEMSETVVRSEQVAQITDLHAILNQISQNGQLPRIIESLNPNNGMGLVHSIQTSASVPPFPPVKEDEEPTEKLSVISTSVIDSTKLHEGGVPGEEHQRSPNSKRQGPGINEEVKNVAEKGKQELEKNQAGSSDARGIVEEGSISNDEKTMRLFKIALVDFVKEILKPTWKEGGMSREDHKTIVKKVVDKVTSTVQGIQIPRTPEKIEQYLAFSKSKITKLVAAYVERLSKAAADV